MKLQERSFEIARKVICEEVDGKKVYTTLDESAFESTRLPEYATPHSAGADFFCAEEVVVPSMWKNFTSRLMHKVGEVLDLDISGNEKYIQKLFQPTIVHTGIKANMFEDEVLEIYNRSSNPKKLGLVLANSVGVVDADYFESEQNDGEIMFAFYNFLPFDITLKVGDKVGQGVFKKVLRPTKGLVVKNDTRKGGFGSTDEKVS